MELCDEHWPLTIDCGVSVVVFLSFWIVLYNVHRYLFIYTIDYTFSVLAYSFVSYDTTRVVLR